MSGEASFAQSATLVRMANQIAVAFSTLPHDEAVAATADHIRLYWAAKMRRDLATLVQTRREAFDARVVAAVAKLESPAR